MLHQDWTVLSPYLHDDRDILDKTKIYIWMEIGLTHHLDTRGDVPSHTFGPSNSVDKPLQGCKAEHIISPARTLQYP